LIGDNFTSPKQLFLPSKRNKEMTIFIGNLSWETEVEDLEQLFSNYGVVKKCYLPLDRETGRKRGFAFVDLNDQNSEKKAIDDLQDVEWMGREIRVSDPHRKC
jgi:RNA recognition motif-containing protein